MRLLDRCDISDLYERQVSLASQTLSASPLMPIAYWIWVLEAISAAEQKAQAGETNPTGIFPLHQFPLCRFPHRQFPFGQLPTSSIPTLSIPIWSMLTKWELTKWKLTKWELIKYILKNRKMWCCLCKLDVGMRWLCDGWAGHYTQRVLWKADRTTVGCPWKFYLYRWFRLRRTSLNCQLLHREQGSFDHFALWSTRKSSSRAVRVHSPLKSISSRVLDNWQLGTIQFCHVLTLDLTDALKNSLIYNSGYKYIKWWTFPLRQLPTSSVPTLSIPTLSTLTKWELTKWELTKWEVDQMGTRILQIS